MLGMLANQAAVALDNAQWAQGLEQKVEERTEELQERVSELQIINSIQQGLASKLDINGIYDLVGDKLREIFGLGDVVISIYDEKTNMVAAPYVSYRGKRIAAEINEWVLLPDAPIREHFIQLGKPHVINRGFQSWAEQFKSHPPTDYTGWPKSSLSTPIIVGDKVTGLIWLTTYDHEDAYSESDVRLISTLASSMGVALENVRLFKAEQERAAELAVINSIQQGLAAELTSKPSLTW